MLCDASASHFFIVQILICLTCVPYFWDLYKAGTYDRVNQHILGLARQWRPRRRKRLLSWQQRPRTPDRLPERCLPNPLVVSHSIPQLIQGVRPVDGPSSLPPQLIHQARSQLSTPSLEMVPSPCYRLSTANCGGGTVKAPHLQFLPACQHLRLVRKEPRARRRS